MNSDVCAQNKTPFPLETKNQENSLNKKLYTHISQESISNDYPVQFFLSNLLFLLNNYFKTFPTNQYMF